jgi:antitoxin (DNA-binding transcriptional repressor) of toxin-antitoxin stability system
MSGTPGRGTTEHPAFPEVTTSDLSRSPRRVLDRIARGERLLVTCHGRPLATLQPLDGVVWQPFTGGVHDIYGWSVTGAIEECDKLSEAQRELLREGVRWGRLVPARLHEDYDFVELIRSIENMHIRGLVRRTTRGWELTGRGMALRETLIPELDAE